MDRETAFLLALGLLIVAGLAVSAGGWVLFVRDRRSARSAEPSSRPSELEEPDRTT